MFLRGSSDDTGRVNILAIFKFAVLAAVQFILYVAEGPVPNYYVGSLRSDHVRGSMLFRWPTPLENILSYFGFYRIAESIFMDPVLVALVFHRETEVNWSWSGVSDDFLSYDFSTDIVRGYPAESITPVKSQKVTDGLVVPEFTPTVDVNWLPSMAGKTISEVERDYQRYRGVNDGDEDTPTDFPADFVDDLDDIFP